MPFLLPLRSRAAVWLLLPGIALTWLYAFTQANISDTVGYWNGVASSATIYTIFSCSFGALSAAIEGSRLRSAQTFRLPTVRSALSISLASIWPSLAIGVLIQLVGFLLSSRGSWGSPSQFPWEIIWAWIAMIVLHVSGGFLLGTKLHVFVAAPLALMLSYVWLGFTWAVDYVPLRYLSGLAISGCCTVYAELATSSIVSVTVFSFAAAAAVWLLIALSRQRSRIGQLVRISSSVALLTAGTALGLSAAADLGPYPSPPRSDFELSCSRTESREICFYPEQQWNVSPTPVAVVSEALENISDSGLPTPDRITANVLDVTSNSAAMVYQRDFTTVDTVHSLSSAIALRHPELLCERDDLDPETGYLSVEALTGLLFSSAMEGREDPYVSEDARPLMSEVLRLTPSERSMWALAVVDAASDCSLDFPEVSRQ